MRTPGDEPAKSTSRRSARQPGCIEATFGPACPERVSTSPSWGSVDPVNQPRLDAEVINDEGSCTVRVSGELAYEESPTLRDLLDPHIRAGERIVIDLSGVAFMDSSGLRTLLNGQHMAERCHGSLSVAALSPWAEQLLTRTGTLETLAHR
jgi:anti-sigma B factor antagonist